MPGHVRQLLEMIRFSHTLFALPFALLAAALAWRVKGQFGWLDLLGILLCMVFARSAAMAFNRLADRTFDAANPRTAGRHLPAGQLSVGVVWLFTLVSSAGFVASTRLFLLAEPPNDWPLLLSAPVLLFLLGYSYTKRFTVLAHFWLGAALMLAPLSAWIAIRGIPSPADLLTPLVLGLAVLFWVAGFDIIYACQDVDFDRQAKLASVPAWLGVRAALRVSAGCHLITLGLLVGLYWAASPYLGVIYLVGVGAVAILLICEHALVRPDDLGRVNRAFFQVNVVISIGLFLVVLADLALQP
ncbi:MAG: putative 4-hydroxybenzoate polyprenyltransferase [Gemmataceae bacterium]|nr:putative 4-hydroxybenzoate polyprenyltransferase [Gemmataceae bacterium]